MSCRECLPVSPVVSPDSETVNVICYLSLSILVVTRIETWPHDEMKNAAVIVGLVLCLAMFLAPGTRASAGFKQPWDVTIDAVNRTAMGALGTARNSADTKQALGCGVHYDAVNGKNNVNCNAADAAGNTAQCATQQAELIQIALGINGDSFLEFDWDRSGTCTNIQVLNSWIYSTK